MARAVAKTKQCIYCGGTIKGVRRGEHVISEAIGGRKTIPVVCAPCNNGPLSDIDRELCSKSALSLAALKALGNSLDTSWEIDREADNLLLEARNDPNDNSMIVYPQMVCEVGGINLHGNADQIVAAGQTAFESVFFTLAARSFRAFESGEKKPGLQFRRISPDPLFGQHRYPPRVFTRHTVEDLLKTERATFEVRYQTPDDKRRALHALSKVGPRHRGSKMKQRMGAHRPWIGLDFEIEKVTRALVKIGFNLLAMLCEETMVDLQEFPHATSFVLGTHVPNLMNSIGFVHPKCLDELHTSNAHAFRLTHSKGHWHVFMSFFGGLACAFANFPGPNRERWRWAQVVAPICSIEWEIQKLTIELQSPRCRVIWADIARIVPSMGFGATHTACRIERRTR